MSTNSVAATTMVNSTTAIRDGQRHWAGKAYPDNAPASGPVSLPGSGTLVSALLSALTRFAADRDRDNAAAAQAAAAQAANAATPPAAATSADAAASGAPAVMAPPDTVQPSGMAGATVATPVVDEAPTTSVALPSKSATDATTALGATGTTELAPSTLGVDLQAFLYDLFQAMRHAGSLSNSGSYGQPGITAGLRALIADLSGGSASDHAGGGSSTVSSLMTDLDRLLADLSVTANAAAESPSNASRSASLASFLALFLRTLQGSAASRSGARGNTINASA